LEALLGALDDMLAAQPAAGGTLAGREEDLGGDDEDVAVIGLERLAQHAVGLAGGIAVRGVDEIAASIDKLADDAVGGLLVAAPLRVAEGHGAQANARNEQAGAAKVAVFHQSTTPPRTARRVAFHGRVAPALSGLKQQIFEHPLF